LNATVVARALPEALQAGAQVDHGAGSAHGAPVLLREDRAPARGDHASGAPGELGQHGGLAAPEALLALELEHGRDRNAGPLHHDAIGVDELEAGLLRERLPEGGLAGTHHAHEIHVAGHRAWFATEGRSSIAEKKAPEVRGRGLWTTPPSARSACPSRSWA
jgi:hypothetical protein